MPATHQSPSPLLIFIHSFASPISIFLQFSPGEGGKGGGKVAASPRIPGACSINFSRFLMFSLYGCSAAGGLRIRLEGLYKADCYPPSPLSLPCSWFAKTCCCARSDSERRLNIFLRRGGRKELYRIFINEFSNKRMLEIFANFHAKMGYTNWINYIRRENKLFPQI